MNEPLDLIPGLHELVEPPAALQRVAIPELPEWALQQAQAEVSKRCRIVMTCFVAAQEEMPEGEVPTKDMGYAKWCKLYARLGNRTAYNDYFATARASGALRKWGIKPIERKSA